ncbi:MAG TPA: sugar ABC transporter permease [Candidatus Borkfalkia excrementigallinarum]|uniref:Sugar ABC transporter permease n=1 Tax=Candidatus Borkfalkia excrementigallinarum TaxID=2838506 RepID=A0A9D1ZVH7_9FIRM|nr:sugar ABC transporter permease [Candidatus Borkfalkia excrementigallinarum]
MDRQVSGLKYRLRHSVKFYLYITPWIVGFLCFTAIPMIFSLYMGFTNATILGIGTDATQFVGFSNYELIFTKDPVFIKSIANTFIYTGLRVFFAIAVSLLFALLLNTDIPGKKLFRTMIYLPAIIPVVGSALLWQLLFNYDMSIFNTFFNALGLPSYNFLSYDHALFSVVFMSVWTGIGPTMVIILAALQGVPSEYIEAAKLDGAGVVRRFSFIVFPLISSSLIFLAITGVIGALQAYAEMDLLTGGGPGDATITMTMQVVGNAFSSDAKGIGYASAQSWFIFVLVMALTMLFMKINNKFVYYGDK